MLRVWKRSIAVGLALSLLPLSPPAYGSSCSAKTSTPHLLTTTFESDAITAPLAWCHQNLILAARKIALEKYEEIQVVYKNPHRRSVIVTGIVGGTCLLILGYPFERLVESWVDGKLRLILFALEFVATGANTFVAFLAQWHLHNGPYKTLRLDWRKTGRIVAFGFAIGLMEAVYYPIGLPHYFPGHGWWPAIWRGIVDIPVSFFFLDPINLYFKLWIAERYPQKEAMQIALGILPKFFKKSWPIWFSLVFIANLSPNPIIIFCFISVATIIWDFQLYTADHTTWKELSDQLNIQWFTTSLWTEGAAASLAVLGWLLYPLWAHLGRLESAIATVVSYALILGALMWVMPVKPMWKQCASAA